MALHPSFDILSRVVDHYESHNRSVRHVEATPATADGDRLQVTMETPVALCSPSGSAIREDRSPETAAITDDGELQLTFSLPSLVDIPPTVAPAISLTETDVHCSGDELLLTIEFSIDPSRETDESDPPIDRGLETGESEPAASGTDAGTGPIDGTEPTGSGAGEDGADPYARDPESDEVDTEGSTAVPRDESIPPYEDTAYLQHLYTTCDNFTEMSERIEMDVSSETVRRYMIEADIHTPNSYTTTADEQDDETASDGDETGCETGDQPSADPLTTAEEQLVTDGIGLPDGLQLTDIVDAVVNSMTVYDVQRALDLDRRETRELLDDLNLLDLVSGTLAETPDRTVSYDTVARRIRQCSPSSA